MDEAVWLLPAADVRWARELLTDQFSTVMWVPGSHEQWSHPSDPVRLRGEHREPVERYRRLGVSTAEGRIRSGQGRVHP
ncbi:hypothetical protein ACFVW2_20710 [Streptomyces sp. NPDC058171]